MPCRGQGFEPPHLHQQTTNPRSTPDRGFFHGSSATGTRGAQKERGPRPAAEASLNFSPKLSGPPRSLGGSRAALAVAHRYFQVRQEVGGGGQRHGHGQQIPFLQIGCIHGDVFTVSFLTHSSISLWATHGSLPLWAKQLNKKLWPPGSAGKGGAVYNCYVTCANPGKIATLLFHVFFKNLFLRV